MKRDIKKYLEILGTIEVLKQDAEDFICRESIQLKKEILEKYGEYIKFTDESGSCFVNDKYPVDYGKVMTVFFDEERKEFLLRLRVVTPDKKGVLYNIHEINIDTETLKVESF